MAFIERVVCGEVAEKLGGVGEVPARPVVARHAIDHDERGFFDVGFDGAVEYCETGSEVSSGSGNEREKLTHLRAM